MIGLDLDNTIICYDTVFREVAAETGVVPHNWSGSREALRRHIREKRGDPAWSALQALVYGPELRRATPFPGAMDCVRALLHRGRELAIVSHKTRVAAADPSCDFHQHAWQWLERCGLLADPPKGFGRERVFFEETREEKVARIIDLQCSHFVDDLPEVFDHTGFPRQTVALLFDPAYAHVAPAGGVVLRDWNQVQEYFLAATPS